MTFSVCTALKTMEIGNRAWTFSPTPKYMFVNTKPGIHKLSWVLLGPFKSTKYTLFSNNIRSSLLFPLGLQCHFACDSCLSKHQVIRRHMTYGNMKQCHYCHSVCFFQLGNRLIYLYSQINYKINVSKTHLFIYFFFKRIYLKLRVGWYVFVSPRAH